MLDDMKEMKKGDKARYNILLVSNKGAETVKHFSVSLVVVVVFLAAVVFLVTAILSYCRVLTEELEQSENNVEILKVRNDELAQQNTDLLEENAGLHTETEELQEKVVILSDTVNGKVRREQEREEEIAKTYVPTGFPLKGTASYNESETELDGNPIAIFHTAQGTSVVATANGTVSSVAGDVEVGYIVMIDHGNGYYTVYRNGATPKVKEGDPVTNMTEIFNMEEKDEALGYQIIENNKFIDPLSLMETYG